MENKGIVSECSVYAYVYVTGINPINNSPSIAIASGEMNNLGWVLLECFNYKVKQKNSELIDFYKKNHKPVITLEQEVVELKAKLANYENGEKNANK